jgi:hypothetical protein
MQCLACRADNKMLLVDVVRDGVMKVPVIERRTYICSQCRFIARQVAFSSTTMPVTLPAISTPPVELQETAAAKTANWTNAVEKLRRKQAALAEEATVRSRVKLAEPAPSERSETPPACTVDRYRAGCAIGKFGTVNRNCGR